MVIVSPLRKPGCGTQVAYLNGLSTGVSTGMELGEMYNGFADGLASQGKFQPMALSPWRPDVTSFLGLRYFFDLRVCGWGGGGKLWEVGVLFMGIVLCVCVFGWFDLWMLLVGLFVI